MVAPRFIIADDVRAWFEQAGLAIEAVGETEEYDHVIARKRLE